MYIFFKKFAEKHKKWWFMTVDRNQLYEDKREKERTGLRCSPVLVGAPYRTRTCDLLHVKQAL